MRRLALADRYDIPLARPTSLTRAQVTAGPSTRSTLARAPSAAYTGDVVDEVLRALTRAAQLGGAAERLACAHALERAGRRDDALDVLVPARADPDVRRELARFPCWSQESGTAGATHDVDTAPLLDPPVVLWRSALLPEPRPEPRLGSWRLIAATPTAIVVYRAKHLAALDPETGETLWVRTGLRMTASSRLDRPFVAGSALVRCHWHHASWFDLRTGDLLREQPIRGACLRGDGDTSSTRLTAVPHRRSDDPELLSTFLALPTEPRLTRPWSHELGDLPFQPDDVVLSELQAVLTTDRPGPGPRADLVALDRDTGALRWALRSGCWRAVVDERGVVAHGETDLLCLTPEGEVRWRTDVTRVWSVILAPERVIVLTGGQLSRLRFHDRGSGTVLAEHRWHGSPPTAARGVIYGADDLRSLTSLSPDGDVLWSVDTNPLAPHASVRSVVPLRRRLYAITERHPDRRARVVCLGAQGR